MSAATSIEWCDRTWNPVRGCSIVSPGCVHCYAMKQAHRFSATGQAYEGLTKQTTAGPQWTGRVRYVADEVATPLRWRKPARVFVNSMSDLFHDDVTDDQLVELFTVMANASQHTFQVLTKRPQRMHEFVSRLRWQAGFCVVDVYGYRTVLARMPFLGDDPRPYWEPIGKGGGEPPRRLDGFIPPNVWLGVSVENQATADERIPLLLQTPAAIRFVSYEPALGPVDFRTGGELTEVGHVDWLRGFAGSEPPIPALDWVIVGGESGPGARPFDVAWARAVVRQCRRAKVPAFVKQLGANVRDRNDAGFTGDTPTSWPEEHVAEDRVEHDLDGTRDGYQGAPVRIHLRDRKGGDPSEWPADLRVREFPLAVEAR